MEQISDDLKKTADNFLADIKEAFGKSLVSVILYGPAARGETSKEPYINFMVAVGDNTPSELAHCTQYLKKWRKNKIALPLFIVPEYVEKSLDTFPLEFMEMSLTYRVVVGTDILDGLEYKKDDVRRQCERELKGKLLHLRAEYMLSRGDTKSLINLVNRSLNTFRVLFAGALYLKKIDIPKETEAILDAVAKAYELDSKLFRKLVAVAKGEIKVDDKEADTLFDLYVEELDKLSNEIDFMS